MDTKKVNSTDELRPDGMDAASAALVLKINAMLNSPQRQDEISMTATRQLVSEIFTTFAGPDLYTGIETHDVNLPGANGAVAARIYYHPKSKLAESPLVVFYHGGGWALGHLDDYDGLMKSLAAQSAVNYISVDYRLAPEHPFPQGLNDAQAAFDYVICHPSEFRGDAGRIGVMGDSAGGNLAAVLAQSDANAGKIKAQFLLYPMLDVSNPHHTYPSRLLFGDGDHFLTRAAIDSSIADYGVAKVDRNDPRVSPLMNSAIRTLPSTYIIVGNCDPLRDEAFAYADRLNAAGNGVGVDCVPGAIHAFLSFGILDNVQTYRTQLAKEVQRRLQAT